MGSAVRAGIAGAIIATVVLLASLTPVGGCIFGPLAWVVYFGVGVLAAYWSKAGASYTLKQSGIDGAVAGGITGLVAHIVKFVIQVVLRTVSA